MTGHNAATMVPAILVAAVFLAWAANAALRRLSTRGDR